MTKRISVIIASLNGEKVLPLCLSALAKTDYATFETIVVDNGSKDRTSEIVRERFPDVRLLRAPRNLGFAGGNNLGLKVATGNLLILLNDDTEVMPDWLRALETALHRHPRAGILGCKLLYTDGKTIQHAGGIIEPNGLTHHVGAGEIDSGKYDTERQYPYVTGAAFGITREVYNRLGGLDEGYFPIYFEEIDYCHNARRLGYECLYVPSAVVYHYESRTTKSWSSGFLYKYHKNRLRFLLKNYSASELLLALRSELKWLLKARPINQLLPLIRAYFANLWNLHSTLTARLRAPIKMNVH